MDPSLVKDSTEQPSLKSSFLFDILLPSSLLESNHVILVEVQIMCHNLKITKVPVIAGFRNMTKCHVSLRTILKTKTFVLSIERLFCMTEFFGCLMHIVIQFVHSRSIGVHQVKTLKDKKMAITIVFTSCQKTGLLMMALMDAFCCLFFDAKVSFSTQNWLVQTAVVSVNATNGAGQ
jgi:hypothetical protein